MSEIDFSDALLEGMLGLLLFAGALHVRLEELRRQAVPVLLMATLGVALSTVIAGAAFSWISGAPLLVALVFGALISPTDPVAVLGVLREADLPPSLETVIAGESLFNDGVGYVVFLLLSGLAFGMGVHGSQAAAASGWAEHAAILFLREAGGGAALGALLGWTTFQLMKRIDDYSVEALLTLGLAFGGYELALRLGVSAPIMAVVAGLFIGHVGMRDGMSARTREYVGAFWSLVDEILNAVLFLLIGVEVFAIPFTAELFATALLAFLLALLARFVSVALPALMLRPFRRFGRSAVAIMTWGGVKGGISVALALSLPESEWKPAILTATYVIVVLSILGQGLTVGRLARRLTRPAGAHPFGSSSEESP